MGHIPMVIIPIIVRAYYRIRYGRIELVREHPRGQWMRKKPLS